MSEKADDLRSTLDALHAQLEKSGDLDEEGRRLLTETVEEIQAKLVDGSDTGEPLSTPGNWVERMREALHHFEDDHPDLVQAVDRVARALANVGF